MLLLKEKELLSGKIQNPSSDFRGHLKSSVILEYMFCELETVFVHYCVSSTQNKWINNEWTLRLFSESPFMHITEEKWHQKLDSGVLIRNLRFTLSLVWQYNGWSIYLNQ